MKKKLKVSMILMELVFLVIVVGGSALAYRAFAPWYYSWQKAQMIEEAFDETKRMDMSNLTDSDQAVFESYEADNLVFTICDELFRPVYTTKKNDPEKQIQRNIKVNVGSFARKPKVVTRDARGPESIRLLGRFNQSGTKYYVCIKENMTKIYSSFSYTEDFLLFVVVIALLIGSLVMYWQSRRIAKPIEQIAKISKQIAERDFSVRAEVYKNYEEVNTLALNFNRMADQLQYYIQKLEDSKDTLEQDNDELQAQNEQWERLDQMRKEFVANVSHELKTPLAVISSQMEMLQAMGDKIDREYYFQSIQEEVQKMTDMVGNLLNISALEHKLDNLEKTELNLSEVAEYLLLRYDALFAQKNLKIEKDIEQDCMVLADREYMEQALNNYLMNAFHHTGNGRYIKIALKREEDSIKASVYNEGAQISENEIQKIWESYYQGEKGENRIGFGLYIVRTIINRHGGQYGVVNEKNGVTFWFSVPELKEPLQLKDSSIK